MFFVPEPRVVEVLCQSDQFCELERLDKVAVCTALYRDGFLIWKLRSGQDYEWQTIEPWLLPDPAQKSNSVFRRQAQIRKDQARDRKTLPVFEGTLVFKIFLRFRAIFNDINEIIDVRFFECGSQQHDEIGVVVRN